MRPFSRALFTALLLVPLATATPIVERDGSNVESNPCLSPALKVDVEEIRGAHVHESVQVKSYKECCQACWGKKGCALYTFVKEDALGNDNYCRLTYGWDPNTLSSMPNQCAAKITTGYEATDGADGTYYNFGPGPCGLAEPM